MPDALLSVVQDLSHRRLVDDRMLLLCGFDEWSKNYRSNTWTDPITRTTILTPTPLQEAWRTTYAGAGFKRYKLADLWVGNSGSNDGTEDEWVENNRSMNGGDWFLTSDYYQEPPAHVKLWTRSSFSANQGWYVGIQSTNVGEERFVILECGWNNADAAKIVSLRFWSDGQCEVWKGGVLRTTESYGGSSASKGGAGGANTANTFVGLLLLPWRIRELLVYSSTGGGFAYAFPDLDDEATGQVILPAGQFWIKPLTKSISVQLASVGYATSGYVCSKLGKFRVAPATGRTVETMGYGFGTLTVTLKKANGTTTLTPNGTDREARVRVDLAGDGTATPYLMAARAGVAPVFGYTSESDEDITCDLKKISLDVPDDPAGVRLSLEYKPEKDIPTTEARLEGSNRPIRLLLGDLPFFDGATEPPEWTLRSDYAGDLVTLEARDYVKSGENFRFRDEIPLDGMTLGDAFRLVAGAYGEDPDSLVISSGIESYEIPQSDSPGEYTELIRVGDTGWSWISRLHETYCATAFLGYKPAIAGYALNITEQSRDQAPLLTVYKKIDDAITIGGYTEEEAPRYVIRSWRERKVEPEANVINVTGYDPASSRPILVDMVDELAKDPATAPGSRGVNWIGEPRVFGVIDPSFTKLRVCKDICAAYYRRLTWPRWLGEAPAQMLIDPATDLPIWRGDAITVHEIGVYRVIGMSIDFVIEVDGRVRRNASYTLEFLRLPDEL